jgi:hypothetical protein
LIVEPQDILVGPRRDSLLVQAGNCAFGELGVRYTERVKDTDWDIKVRIKKLDVCCSSSEHSALDFCFASFDGD